MPQKDLNRIVDHAELFQQPEYQQMFQNKREQFENMPSQERVKEIAEWTKTWEYREKGVAEFGYEFVSRRVAESKGLRSLIFIVS